MAKTSVLFLLLVAGSATLAAAPIRGAATAPAKGAVNAADAATLYDDTTRRYLSGDWESLAADLAQQARTISAMSKEQQADMAYIKQAVTDGRPAWWNQVKQGQKTTITAKVWQTSITALYDPNATGISVTTGGGRKSVVVGWPAGNMDSPDQAEHGFTRGELAYVVAWTTLASAEVYSQNTFQHFSSLSDAAKTKFIRYVVLRSIATAGYYGTPRARRWAAFLGLDAYFGDHTTVESFIQRKAFGAMLVAEIVGHPWKYPSFRLPRVNQNNPEGSPATGLMNQFANVSPTFAEDKALREAIKEFAGSCTANVFSAGKVTLPNKPTIMLDPTADADTAAKRNAWLLDKLQNPETRPADPRNGAIPLNRGIGSPVM